MLACQLGILAWALVAGEWFGVLVALIGMYIVVKIMAAG